MKPRILIIRKAESRFDNQAGVKYQAVFEVDDMRFRSDLPESTREAIEINTAIERLVEAVKP